MFDPYPYKGRNLSRTCSTETRLTMDYDLLVIGAGIHGVTIARAAAERGYQVLVLEQYAGPAQGTSSKSSKLIHGGLRFV